MFANDVALASARDGAPLDSGAVVVMEVCKARLDADENPAVGSDGLFEPDEMAGIAVMENRFGPGRALSPRRGATANGSSPGSSRTTIP